PKLASSCSPVRSRRDYRTVVLPIAKATSSGGMPFLPHFGSATALGGPAEVARSHFLPSFKALRAQTVRCAPRGETQCRRRVRKRWAVCLTIALLLSSQGMKNLPEFTPHFPKQDLPPALRDEEHMVFAVPLHVG